MKTQSTYIIVAATVVVVGAVAFFGGMHFQKTQRRGAAMELGNGQFRQMGGGNFQGAGAGRGMTAFRPVSGEIVSQDDKTITVKLPDGSTKIVILSEQMTVNKSEATEKSQLKTGEKITVFGTANQDGSVTAQNISIGEMMMRPATPSSEQK